MTSNSFYSSKSMLDIVSVYKNLYKNSHIVLLFKDISTQIEGIEYLPDRIVKLDVLKSEWEPDDKQAILSTVKQNDNN